jgi:hypothetical protein
VYLNSLSKGVFSISIPLTARFTGGFQMNPVKAELMYFPVLNGNNQIQKIEISKN